MRAVSGQRAKKPSKVMFGLYLELGAPRHVQVRHPASWNGLILLQLLHSTTCLSAQQKGQFRGGEGAGEVQKWKQEKEQVHSCQFPDPIRRCNPPLSKPKHSIITTTLTKSGLGSYADRQPSLASNVSELVVKTFFCKRKYQKYQEQLWPMVV